MACRSTQQGVRFVAPTIPTIPTVQVDVVATEAAVAGKSSFDPSQRHLWLATGAVSIVSLVGFLLWFMI